MKLHTKILRELKKQYTIDPNEFLVFSTPLQLLIATILSAQCTDKRVNMVTPKLFARYKTAADFASADISELEGIIRSTGFYHNKAKNIKGACQKILTDFLGNVPQTMEELLQLPGVARKTANIVLLQGFGITKGIAVDTHVGRLAFRLGLTSEKDPVKIERDLCSLYPKKEWQYLNRLLILHGRAVCKAPIPVCSMCFLSKWCPKKGLVKTK